MRKAKKVSPEEKYSLPNDNHKRESNKSNDHPKEEKKRHSIVSLGSIELPGSTDDKLPPEIERLRIRKTLRAAADLISFGEGKNDDNVAGQSKKKFLDTVKDYCAKADVFASAHVLPKHRICITAAALFIPVSIVLMTWDFLATIVFQIPHLSAIDSPGFILFVNFVAMPIAMYGYMMEYLMHENSRHAKLALACVVCHLILFSVRAYMECHFDGYRNELKLYFETFEAGSPFDFGRGASKSLNLNRTAVKNKKKL